MQAIEMIEEQTIQIAQKNLSKDIVSKLYESKFFEIIIPANNQKPFLLRSKGYVGHIDIGGQIFSIQPKAKISNVFEMLEIAYNQKLTISEGYTSIDTVDDIIERITLILAKKVNDRLRKGIYREYVSQTENLQFVRGRVNITENLHNALFDKTRIVCDYEDLTANLEENQLLLWALYLGNKKIKNINENQTRNFNKKIIHEAYRNLLNNVSLKPFSYKRCMGRNYNKLNYDYKPMHDLCRIIIQLCGPTTLSGDKNFSPFYIYMPSLFEGFVAEVLKNGINKNLFLKTQDPYRLKIQNPVNQNNLDIEFKMDIVIREKSSNSPICVIDTKYKIHERPKDTDIWQVVAYCEEVGTDHGILVYPTKQNHFTKITVGSKKIMILGIDLDGSLSSGADSFIKDFNSSILEDYH